MWDRLRRPMGGKEDFCISILIYSEKAPGRFGGSHGELRNAREGRKSPSFLDDSTNTRTVHAVAALITAPPLLAAVGFGSHTHTRR